MIRSTLLFTTAVLLTACGGSAPEGAPAATEAAASTASEARKVTTITAEFAPFDHFFTVQGNVETDRLAQVFPMTQGTILRIRVEEGQAVRKNQVLIELDNDAVARNQDELNTRLTLAKDVLSRQERLWEQGIGTEVQLLEARTNVKALQESIAAFSEQVDFGTVTAPFAGTVDRIFAKEGGMASPGMPVARIMDLNDMYVRAMVSDHYVGKVKAGQRVDIVMAGRDTLTSAIARVGRYIEPANRTFEIVVPIPENNDLLPNEFAALRINDLHLDSAIAVPSSLILQNRKGQDFIYMMEGGKAIRQAVTIGPSAGDQVLILEGVTQGMTIIDRGAGQVVEGEAIQVIR
ncbi:MAG: efflux RND transporter periplasmic adaptor subunit [Flavobacteriales bacterium]|nr:efflux RND transporter periplasmic adaptor subunit [Flavobacteriales bacterium]